MADALELDALWEDFHRAVNMTSAELAAWLRVRDAEEETEPLPEQAGTDTGRHVLALLQKRRTDLTEDDLRVMSEVVETVGAQTDPGERAGGRRHPPAAPADDAGPRPPQGVAGPSKAPGAVAAARGPSERLTHAPARLKV